MAVYVGRLHIIGHLLLLLILLFPLVVRDIIYLVLVLQELYILVTLLVMRCWIIRQNLIISLISRSNLKM